MYIDYADYSAVYSDLTESEFAYKCFIACLEMDKQTKGVDGYSKLDNAFPTDEKNEMAVKVCAIELVHLLNMLDRNENAFGFDVTDDGKYIGKQINSVSSGSESVSYTSGGTSYKAEDKKKLIYSMIRDYLSGITDKNGVNLLYMGAYPNVYGDDNDI